MFSIPGSHRAWRFGPGRLRLRCSPHREMSIWYQSNEDYLWTTHDCIRRRRRRHHDDAADSSVKLTVRRQAAVHRRRVAVLRCHQPAATLPPTTVLIIGHAVTGSARPYCAATVMTNHERDGPRISVFSEPRSASSRRPTPGLRLGQPGKFTRSGSCMTYLPSVAPPLSGG